MLHNTLSKRSSFLLVYLIYAVPVECKSSRACRLRARTNHSCMPVSVKGANLFQFFTPNVCRLLIYLQCHWHHRVVDSTSSIKFAFFGKLYFYCGNVATVPGRVGVCGGGSLKAATLAPQSPGLPRSRAPKRLFGGSRVSAMRLHLVPPCP